MLWILITNTYIYATIKRLRTILNSDVDLLLLYNSKITVE